MDLYVKLIQIDKIGFSKKIESFWFLRTLCSCKFPTPRIFSRGIYSWCQNFDLSKVRIDKSKFLGIHKIIAFFKTKYRRKSIPKFDISMFSKKSSPLSWRQVTQKSTTTRCVDGPSAEFAEKKSIRNPGGPGNFLWGPHPSSAGRRSGLRTQHTSLHLCWFNLIWTTFSSLHLGPSDLPVVVPVYLGMSPRPTMRPRWGPRAPRQETLARTCACCSVSGLLFSSSSPGPVPPLIAF